MHIVEGGMKYAVVKCKRSWMMDDGTFVRCGIVYATKTYRT